MQVLKNFFLFVILILFSLPFTVNATVKNIPNLAGHWNFSESFGNNVLDSSGNSNNGILENGALRGIGKIGGAVIFDGNDDRINIITSGNINNMTAMTVTGWVYPQKNSIVILRKSSLSAAPFNMGMDVDGLLYLRAGYVVQTGVWKTQQLLALNTWHHFAVTYNYGDVNSDPIIYINGNPQSISETQAPFGSTVSDDATLLIGNNPLNTSGFLGKIDSIRMYNRTLTSQEINDIYDFESASRPNIVVIMTDDQEDGPSMNVMTKVKNLIADQGVTFKNSFVDNSGCCPSRATFITGQYCHNHGVFFIGGNVTFNGINYGGGYGALHPTASNTLPAWLQEAGYTTGMFGKYLNGYGTQISEYVVPPGWNKWFARVDGLNGQSDGLKYYDYTINNDGSLARYGFGQSDYFTDVITQEALSFINQANSSQPFFVYFNPVAPHVKTVFDEDGTALTQPPEPALRHKGLYSTAQLPKTPSFNEADVSDKPVFMQDLQNPLINNADITAIETLYQARLESLLSVDEAVEQIINALQTKGLLDNTYLIYTSDNGFLLGEHRRPQEKRLVYEESVRVPLLIRGPGIPTNEIRSHLISNVDLAATVIDVAKAEAGRTLDGRSVISIINSPSQQWRSALLLQSMDKLAYTPFTMNPTLFGIYRAVRTNSYVYIEHELNKSIYPPSGANPIIEKEFYNLASDPYELASKHNDSSYASVTQDLQSKLSALRGCQGATCWMISSELSPPLPAYQCSDNQDNDLDGKVDYPADPGCADADDNDETDTPLPPTDTIPPVISNISSSVTTNSAIISFATNEQSSSYIDYGLSTNYGQKTSTQSNQISFSFVLSNLSSNTTYNFRITAADSSNNTSQSVNYTFKTNQALFPDTTPPLAITNLSALNITQTSVDLTWTAPGDDGNIGAASSYDLRYSTSQITDLNFSSSTQLLGEPAPNTAGTSQTYIVTGLNPSTTYYFAIKSSDEVPNVSSISNIASATTLPISVPPPAPPSGGGGGGGSFTDNTPPAKPQNFISLSADKQITLRWSNPTDSDFVRVIIIKKDNMAPTSLADGATIYEGNGEEFTDTNLDNNKIYYYAIFAYDKKPNYSEILVISAQPQAGKELIEIKEEDYCSRYLYLKSLFKLAGNEAEVVSACEAKAAYGYNSFVNFDKTSKDIYDKLRSAITALKGLLDAHRYSIAYFIHSGTPTTQILGKGERAGVISSFYQAFKKLPETESDWSDIIKIANGRWPALTSQEAEKTAKKKFKQIYLKEPNMSSPNDNAAVTVISYGLRPANRNLNSEKNAIKIFKAIYKISPLIALDWDIVRAIAYSGAKR